MSDRIPDAAVEALKFYVYRLIDPRDGSTFYVGKGIGQRVLQHAKAALETADTADRLDRIREIMLCGLDVQIVIHRHGLDEATAFVVEGAVIDAYPNLTNLVAGHHSIFSAAPLDELLERYAAPKADIDVPAILIKIEREWRPDLSMDQLYERTRRYWRCQPTLRKPPPTHAMAIARGIVREVYTIDRWVRYDDWPADRDFSRSNSAGTIWSGGARLGFEGAVCAELQTLRGSSVRHLVTGSAQNPITYVNC